VEGLPVDVSFQLGVQLILSKLASGLGNQVIEIVNWVAITTVRDVVRSPEALHCNKWIFVLASNFASVVPELSVDVITRESLSPLTVGASLKVTVAVVFRSATSGVASPANIAEVIDVISRVGAGEGDGRVVIVSRTGIGLIVGFNDARSGERRDDTRESGAIIEVVIVALTVLVDTGFTIKAVIQRATAMGGVNESVATVTKIVVDSIAVTIVDVAKSFQIVVREVGGVKTGIGNALRNGGTVNSIAISVGPNNLRRTAGSDGGEVARVPVVQGVAVLRVSTLLSVTLANINEVRSLGRQQKVASRVRLVIDKDIVVPVTPVVLLDMGVGLSLLPGVKRRRASATQLGRGGNAASTNLVRDAIGDVPFVVGSPVQSSTVFVLGGENINVVVLEVNEAINALRRAGGPLGPAREHAVLLNALELVSALNARSDRSRADTDFVERSLDERDTKDILQFRLVAKLVEPIVVSGPGHVINLEAASRGVLEVDILTAVVGRSQGATIASLDGNVTEDVRVSFHVPEITAVIRTSAESPCRPVLIGGIMRGDIGIRPLLINGSLATVVEVIVFISATSEAITIRDTRIIIAVLGARPNVVVTVSEERKLRAVNATIAAIVVATVDINAAAAIAVSVALVASQIAETGLRKANTNSVDQLIVSLIEVVAVTGNDARLVVLPGESALAVRMLPRINGVLKLGSREVFGINRAEIAVDLTTVLGKMVAVEESLLALIEAMSGPAILVREIVNGVPEGEVALNWVNVTVLDVANEVLGVVIKTVAVNINPGDAVHVLGPVATVALWGDGISSEINVVSSSEVSVTQQSAVVGSAGVIVALPVLLIQHTSEGAVVGVRKTTADVELGPEALTVLLGSGNDGTGTDADTTSPVTIAGSRAL